MKKKAANRRTGKLKSLPGKGVDMRKAKGIKGGGVAIHDIVVTKRTDKASVDLFLKS